MANLITNVSKYLMILLIAIYTYYNFRFFGIRDEWGKRRLCRLQNVVMVLIHTLAYLIIYLRTEDEKTLMFFGAQLLFFFLYMGLYRLFYRNLSRLLLNNACMLLSTSFIILTRISMDRAVRQFAIVAVAAAVTMIIPFIMDRAWQLSKIPWVYGSTPGSAFSSVRHGKYGFWSAAFYQYRRLLLSAVRVCKDQLCILCGHYVLPLCRFQDDSHYDCCGRGPCAGAGDVQGSGKRADFLCHLSADAVCGDGKLALPGTGSRQRSGGGCDCLQPVFPCAYQGGGMAGSLERYFGKGISDQPVPVRHWNGRMVWHGALSGDAV